PNASRDHHLLRDRLAPRLPHRRNREGGPLPTLAQVKGSSAGLPEPDRRDSLEVVHELVVSVLRDLDEPTTVRFREELDVPARRIHGARGELGPQVAAETHFCGSDRESPMAQVVTGRDRLRTNRP